MFQIPRGTRDFTSEEMEKRQFLENSIKSIFKRYGYREIKTPTFETLELFTSKSGEGIIDELYNFTDKGGRNLTLRPELTAPVMRFYVEKLQMEAKPLKMFYFGNCYRYDRPQKGRYREFRQAGCEIIGTNKPEAYAELIAMAYGILKNVGLKEIKLYIGNLNILSSIFKIFNISKEYQKKLLPLIDKSQFTEVSDFLYENGFSKEVAENFIEILQTSDFDIISKFVETDEDAKKEILYLKEILDLLENIFKIQDFQIKMGIVRGLDYYKGIVFEIDAPILGAEKQLCGGGAYELISLFGGRESPTAGFAIGFDRTIIALELENYSFPIPKLDAYVIPVNEDMVKKALEITQDLRSNKINADTDLLRRGIGKSLKYASSKNTEKVIIVGPDELDKNSITVRDMESGNQKLIKIENIYKLFS